MIIALTNLFGEPGGIPAFNRLLCHAAWQWTRAQHLPLTVLALMDARTTTSDSAVLPSGASYVPFGGDRRRFSASLWARLLGTRPAPRLCLGHVNLAVLGLAAPRGFGVVAHGTEVWSLLSLPRRLALRRARAVACVSDDTARKTEWIQGVAPERVARVINALDPWRFPLAPAPQPFPLPVYQRPVRVLSLTRLSPQEPKGIDLVLRALPSLPQAEYTVAGDGADRPRLERLARELGVAARVRFLGRVSDEGRAAELRRCEIFALPSSGEGFGIVYLEAMAYSKPCLAARAGGAPEVVIDGHTGLVVTPQTDAVAGALHTLCSDARLRARLGAAGRSRLLSTYTYDHFRTAANGFFVRL